MALPTNKSRCLYTPNPADGYGGFLPKYCAHENLGRSSRMDEEMRKEWDKGSINQSVTRDTVPEHTDYSTGSEGTGYGQDMRGSRVGGGGKNIMGTGRGNSSGFNADRCLYKPFVMRGYGGWVPEQCAHSRIRENRVNEANIDTNRGGEAGRSSRMSQLGQGGDKQSSGGNCLFKNKFPGYGGFVPPECIHSMGTGGGGNSGADVGRYRGGGVGGNRDFDNPQSGQTPGTKCLFKDHPYRGYGGFVPEECVHSRIRGPYTDANGSGANGADVDRNRGGGSEGNFGMGQHGHSRGTKCLFNHQPFPGYAGYVPEECAHGQVREPYPGGNRPAPKVAWESNYENNDTNSGPGQQYPPQQQANPWEGAPQQQANPRESAPQQLANPWEGVPFMQQANPRESAQQQQANPRESAPQQQANPRHSAPQQQPNPREGTQQQANPWEGVPFMEQPQNNSQ